MGAPAQSASDLPPVVVQPPSAPTASRRVVPTQGPVRAARPAAAPRRNAPAAPQTASAATPAPVPTPTNADTASASGPTQRGFTAGPTGLNLQTPNTSGSRLGLTPFQTPASIEIIPGQKIQERGQNTVQEAITQNATGITNIGAPGNGFQSYTARGFAGVGSVATLYDGTRTYVASGTVTFPFDTWNIDRIEVLRGPASVLYGEGAIGGVVNIVPKKPTFQTLNEFRVAYGSDNARRLAWDSGGAVSQDVAYRFNISGDQSDGWMKQNGQFRNLAISGALLWQVNPEFAITLSHDYGYNEPLAYFGSPLINGKVPRALRFQNYNVSNDQIIFSDNFTQIKAEWNAAPGLTLRNVGYYLSSDRHYRDVETYAFQPLTGLVRRSDYIQIYHDLDQIGNRFDATYKHDLFGMKNTFLAGFDVNHIDFKHTNNSPYAGTSFVRPVGFDPGLFLNASPTGPGFRTSTNQASFFAEDRLAVTDQLALVAGVRYEAPTVLREDLRAPASSFKNTYEYMTYRFGAVYNPFPDTALFVQYATGVDLLGNLITTSFAQRLFKPATGRQIEGGIKQSLFDGWAEFTLTGYHIEKDNLLVPDPSRPTVSVQVGSQSSTGIEAFASVKLHETVRLEGNIALLQAQYDNFSQAVSGQVVSYRGNRPVDVPEEVANLWVSWAFWPRWEARVGLQHVGTVFSDFANTSKRPAYNVLNASLDYRITDNSKFSLRGYNLTDEVYAVRGNTTTWLLGRPRSFELAYQVAF